LNSNVLNFFKTVASTGLKILLIFKQRMLFQQVMVAVWLKLRTNNFNLVTACFKNMFDKSNITKKSRPEDMKDLQVF